MTAEVRLLKFIDDRLERMLATPEMWGSNESIELQVLQLLEFRTVLLSTVDTASRWREIQRDYVRFLASEFPEAPPVPLANLVADSGRDGDFTTLLARFVEDQLELLNEGIRSRPATTIAPTKGASPERLPFRYRGELGTKRIEFPAENV